MSDDKKPAETPETNGPDFGIATLNIGIDPDSKVDFDLAKKAARKFAEQVRDSLKEVPEPVRLALYERALLTVAFMAGGSYVLASGANEVKAMLASGLEGKLAKLLAGVVGAASEGGTKH